MKEQCRDWMHQEELPCLLVFFMSPPPRTPLPELGIDTQVHPAAAARSWLSLAASCVWMQVCPNGSCVTPLTVSAVDLDPQTLRLSRFGACMHTCTCLPNH